MIGRRWRFFSQANDFSLEFSHALKVVIDARKSNVRNLINISQSDGHTATDLDAWNFVFEVAVNSFIDFVRDSLLDIFWNWALATRRLNAAKNIRNVERNTRAIFLHDLDACQFFSAFIAGESFLASNAFASAPNRMTAFDRSAIDNSCVGCIAVWAVHD